MTSRTATVLGAGAVGICSALALLERGFEVKLVDRKGPAEETSYGNAGVISTSSILPVLAPRDLVEIPKAVLRISRKLRFSMKYAACNVRSLAKTLSFATSVHAQRTAAALAPLTKLSASEYLRIASLAGLDHLLAKEGWLNLYRTKTEWDAVQEEIELIMDQGFETQRLSAEEIRDLEPHLNPIYHKGVWFKESLACLDPGKFLTGIAGYFVQQGGAFMTKEAKGFAVQGEQCEVAYADGEKELSDVLVIALGAWSKDFLRKHCRIPLFYERGYHAQFVPEDGVKLNRPIAESDRGYVMNHMLHGIRITSGAELGFIDAPQNHALVRQAIRSAAEAFPLGKPDGELPWLGRRPTLPDFLPMIGRAETGGNVLFAFGHQHIGLTTAAGTGNAIGSLAANEPPPFDLSPFRTDRFQRN